MKIALIDKNDNIIGYEEKLKVHQEGLLHRAFSIIIFNSKGEMLIHQRALDKYHSANLWTNACCSHLAENESMDKYIHKRLIEEMGFDCELDYLMKFNYRVELENNLIENETDYIYKGLYDGIVSPNPSEVRNWKWTTMKELNKEVKANPDNFTHWFKIILEKLK